jgi:hypothetical protein
MQNIRYCSYLSPAESSTYPHLISCFYEPFSYYPPFTLMSAKWSPPTKFCTLFSWRSLFNFVYPTVKERSRGSSGSIVSDYGLDDRAIGVRSQAGAKDFFSLTSVSRLALWPTQPPVQWVPGVLCPGAKRGQSVTLTTHPIQCRGREWVGAKPLLPPSASMACSGTALAFYCKRKVKLSHYGCAGAKGEKSITPTQSRREWSASRPSRASSPGKRPPVPIG